MKRIAVFIHSLTIEYALDVLQGISHYFEDKDVQLIIGQTKEPNCDVGLFEYQCWASAEYLFSEQIDAYIIIAGSYASRMTTRSLSKFLEKIGDRPIVSIGMDLNINNCYFVRTESQSAYTTIIKHLKEKHGCKKIAFFSANATRSTEATERFEAYKQAMKNNNLTYDDSMILSASFTKSTALIELNNKIKTKEDVNFDAILCANDLMALSTVEYLQNLGLSIPKDVIVFGFDETTHATTCKPKLSTIDQNIYNQGVEGAKILDDVMAGLTVEKTTILPVTPLFRQSCGCIPLDNMDIVHLDEDGKLHHRTAEREKYINVTSNYLNFLGNLDEIYNLFDIARSATPLNMLFYSLGFILDNALLSNLDVCFFDEPKKFLRDDNIVLPEKLRLSMSLSKHTETNVYEPGVFFNPAKEYIPEKYAPTEKGIYLIQPIFSGELSYGYMHCKLDSKNFAIYGVFTKIIANALTQSFEFTRTLDKNKQLEIENIQLHHDNTSLDKNAKTDELTNILNRRGFFELGQKQIDLSIESNNSGLIFFADMDGLKKINDGFGHEMGDVALKSLAKALSKSFRTNDIVGRLSGDEFGIVAPGMTKALAEKTREKIAKYCKEAVNKQNLPFNLSCSLGYIGFSKSDKNLKALLNRADEDLYVEKREKHKNQ